MDATTSAVEYPQTRFFQACRGVFEGGGTRAAAHVGAYEAAVRCGVNFSEVAGTSAGSMVAALIGAGASPKYLVESLANLKFSSLLSMPEGRIKTPWLARTIGPLMRGAIRPLGRIAEKGSAYSSEAIQHWVDDRLAELLPNATRPIKFRDLRLPTKIVATDLAGRRPKIWSTEDTPDEHVGFAVRCSCSIPLFFEPVEAGADLYVDGGMLSNLPAFVFAQARMDALALGGRILCFRLASDAAPATTRDIRWVAKRLIDAAISGATAIQSSLVSNVSTVQISTGRVSSTDFDIGPEDVTSLLNAGRSAVRDFVRSEHLSLDDVISTDVARYGEDELFDDLTREMATSGKRLLVACQDTRWFWALFPSVAYWAFEGAAIDVCISEGPRDGREQQRRGVMKRLGIRFHRVPRLPFTGFVLERLDDRQDAAFLTHISETRYSPTGAVYIGAKHRPVIRSLARLLDQYIDPKVGEAPRLRLEEANADLLIRQLKQNVNQYVGPGVSLSMERVDLRADHPTVQLIVRRIRSYKYRQIATLLAVHKRFNVPLGAAANIYAGDRLVSTITPPVLEAWGDHLVAVEGNTRLFYLDRTGADSVPAIVVRGVLARLPGTPVEVRDALLATYQLSPAQRIKGFRYEDFRSIEGAVRPEEKESGR